MDLIEKTKRLAESHSVQFKDCGEGHIQLRAHGNLVNYYPLSKRRTLYSPTLNRRETNCTPWDAVRVCLSEAKKNMKPIPERKLPRNTPQVNLKPVRTNPAGLKHFYDGDIPPWEESAEGFQPLAYSDALRLTAYRMEQNALMIRAKAEELDGGNHAR